MFYSKKHPVGSTQRELWQISAVFFKSILHADYLNFLVILSANIVTECRVLPCFAQGCLLSNNTLRLLKLFASGI